MRRGPGCLLVVVVFVAALALVGVWLGWPVLLGVVVVLGLVAFFLVRSGRLVVTLTRGYPGDGIGVPAPARGIVTEMSSADSRRLVALLEDVEQGDPAVQRVVGTIAVLRADGVPRGVLRVPDGELSAEDAWELGFAGLDVDALLDRLRDAGLLRAEGDAVVMDPLVALAARVRAEPVESLIAVAGEALYAHALHLRMLINRNADNDAEVMARVRELLPQAVTLAWHTKYTYDKAMDTILQCNACLGELGALDDAYALARQMLVLCERNLGAVHPVTQDARESVDALREMRRRVR